MPPPQAFADGIAVPFAGGDHDWAAAELGAWLAAGASAKLLLIGAEKAVTMPAMPAGCWLRRPSPSSSSWASTSSRCLRTRDRKDSWRPLRTAGIAVVGLSPRWRREGLGESRRALLQAVSPTLLVHRGARPGGLAPREQLHPLHVDDRRGWPSAAPVPMAVYASWNNPEFFSARVGCKVSQGALNVADLGALCLRS